MSESSDGIYIEDYEHHEYCERCHHEMELVIGVEDYYDGFYCKNCGMNHPLREMRNEIILWLNCPYCAGDRMEAFEPSGYVCTDCGAEFYPENMKSEQRKAFYLNDFVGFEKYDNQTVAKNATVQKGEEKVKNDIDSVAMGLYDGYEIGGPMPENYTGKKCLRCGSEIVRVEDDKLVCSKCKVVYVERPNETLNKEKDLNCPGCGVKLKKVAGDNHLYYCIKCGRCYEDAGAFLVNKPLHCKNCGRSILAYNPKEFKYECPKCEATYYPTGEGCDKFCNKFQEEFYMGSVTEVKTVPVKDEPKKDAINPQHYKGKGGMQAIDVIEAFGLGFCLGNAVKYILRAGKKDAYEQELKKAIWYIERAIKENS